MRLTEVIRYGLPAAVWSAVILFLSGAPASAEHSGGWLRWALAHTIGPLEPDTFDIVHYLVRKLSHVLAYGFLGALCFHAVRQSRAGWHIRWAVTATLLSGAVATIDEFLQALSPARTGAVSDVALDVAAAAAATVIWMVFSRR